MLCGNCGIENASNSRFCNQCGTPLGRACPKCSRSNAADAKFCSECAAPLAAEMPQRSARPIASKIAPEHPEAAAEGERKIVTALFADIKGSTALEQDLDPEEARAIIDPALKLMIAAVHRYDGYVVQSTGDGIFAMFGAPLAHEDHPQRALYAALRMQQDLRGYAATLREQGHAPLEIRVGVNTGEVVVRTIQTAQGRAEYTPIGHAANLASRMQTLAATGTIAATEDTRRLCEGFFTFRSLGATRVKGVTQPINVHEATGLGPLRTRLQASARRGLSRFVGREAELTQMRRTLDMACAGRGQIVAAVGEAGVGKSRLFYEFQAVVQPGCLMLEAVAVAHGRASAYLPLIDLLKSYFEIGPDDDARRRREKIAGKTLMLDRALEEVLPYIFNLLEAAERDDLLLRMDAEQLRRNTLDAIKRILLRESLNRPIIVVFEDLHWLDDGSRALLNLLADAIASARVMVVVNYRPEFTHNWGNKTYYTQLRLDPLGAQNGEEMLNGLLGPGAELEALKRAIIERTDGNPFFMEEIVQALFEQDALIRNGVVRLAKSLDTIQIPSTVQAVLASRIDRLSPEDKDLLQVLAVIGKEFPYRLVREVSGKSDEALQKTLSELQRAEFIYEQPAVSEIAYVFKHALSQQVASGSTLTERRRSLHERVAHALETQFPQVVEEQPELIADHYTEAGLSSSAIPYWQRAAERALERWANVEAIDHLRKGLKLLDASERDRPANVGRDDDIRRCAMLLKLGMAQFRAGEFTEAISSLLRSAQIAKSLGSAEKVIEAALELVMITHLVGAPVPEVVPLLDDVLKDLDDQDTPLKATALSALARYLASVGEQQRLMTCAPQALEMARRFGDPVLIGYCQLAMYLAMPGPEHAEQRLATATEVLSLAKSADDILLTHEGLWYRGLSLLELGDVAASESEISTWERWTRRTNQPFYDSISAMYRSMRALMMGHFDDCERLAQHAFAVGRQLRPETAAGVFGLQMFALRREQGRLKEVEPAMRIFVAQHSAAESWRPGLTVVYSELGLIKEAREQFEAMAQHDFDDVPRDSLWMGTMSYLVDVCAFLRDTARARVLYDRLVPFAGRNVLVSNAVACYGAVSRYLGMLASILERWDLGERHFEDALAMNARMEARPWLARTQHQYAAMLLGRRKAGDLDRAVGLLEAASATAREVGMRALEQRVAAQIASAKSGLN